MVNHTGGAVAAICGILFLPAAVALNVKRCGKKHSVSPALNGALIWIGIMV